MTDYIRQHLRLDEAGAQALRLHYWRTYGATLKGLMHHHQIDARHFLQQTHRFDDLSRMLAESGGDGCDSNMRHIVVSLSAALGENEPDRTTEGLRAAVGLVRSTECHDVEIVLEGGGVTSWSARYQ